MSKVKHYLPVVLVIIALLVSQIACDDTPVSSGSGGGSVKSSVSSGGSGADWLVCSSLTCTYKVTLGHGSDVRTAIKGVRINRATAVPLGGKWKSI